MQQHRDNLLNIFNTALDAVSGERVVKRELESGEYPDQFHVIAIGKAADAMLRGVMATETARSKRIKSALLISKHGHISNKTQQDARINCIESDHPVPQQHSLDAGDTLLEYLNDLDENEPCLFLISGGASSLVEVLEPAWDLRQLQEVTDYLLANAYSIDQINAIRQRLSKIKGGGLWDAVGKRPVNCLMISDVPDDDPAIIGSGLLFPTSESALPTLSEKWQSKLKPFVKKQQGENFQWKIIASLEIAKKAAQTKAKALGYAVELVADFVDDEASKSAEKCVRTIIEKPNTLFIWGGETTVYLPENSGKGGRNQHLGLSAAVQLSSLNEAYLLAAGTDGTDGLTDATGAIVDHQTISAGLKKNLNANEFLQQANSNAYLDAVKSLIVTGATGTNVMDLILGISCSDKQ